MPDLFRETSTLVVPSWSARFAAGLTGAAIFLAVLGSRSTPKSLTHLAPPPTPVVSAGMPATLISAAITVPLTAVKATSEPAHPAWGPYFLLEIDGAAYLRLADLEDGVAAARPRAPLALSQRGETSFAAAPLAAEEVPAPYRAWIGKQVIADERCSARVIGLAVVAQLVGDPVYADHDGDWTAEAVFEHGHRMLAARLDGCAGTRLARDAAATRFEIPSVVTSPASARLIAAAHRAVLSSEAAAQAQARWTEGGGEGRWQDDALFDARVLRHHGTRATWVIVFARNQTDCSLPEINLLATFQVGSGGALRPVTQRLVEELHTVEMVLDSDGDGRLEMLGRPWLGFERVITDPSGEVKDRLEAPFYGCPC